MTASSGVVLSNLAYLLGAILLAVIGGVIVWLHHRQPKSVDANVESFHRGLRALAPDASDPGPLRPIGPAGSRPVRIQPRSTRSPETAAETGDRSGDPPHDPAPAADPKARRGPADPADQEPDAPPPDPAASGAEPVLEPGAPPVVVDLSSREPPDQAAGDGAGDRAGAETG